MKKISVITPSFNAAEYLGEMIESVALQQGVEFEHIIIDDCSTDASRDVLASYEAKYGHLKVVYLTENIGQSRARNIGIDLAGGEYIAFLDSDDYYLHSTALQAWYAAAKQNDADLVRANYKRLIDGKSESVDPQNTLAARSESGLNLETAPELVNNTSCWLMLYRAGFLRDNEIRFSERLRQREDRPFFLLAMMKAKTVNLIPDQLIMYRVRPDSTMRSITWDQLDLFATHLEVVSDYVLQYAGGGGLLPFRRANLLYYVKNIIEYWRGLLIKPEGPHRPEFKRFFELTRTLVWETGLLRDDVILDRVNAEKKESYYYDFARCLLQRGKGLAFKQFVEHGKISIGDAESILPDTQADGDQEWWRDRESVYNYLRQNPPFFEKSVNKQNRSIIESLPPVILHAGMTKTGSSSLQTFFEENRFVLYHKYGVYYPFAGLEHGSGDREHRTSGHAGLIGNVLNGKTTAVENLALEIASLPARPRLVFLSSENVVSERFWGNGDAPRAIAEAFRGVDLRAVVCLRRQEDWLESAYVESITSPGIRYREEPMDFAEKQRKCGLLDYLSIDSAWKSHFGRDKIIYRSYENAREAGGTIDDFLAVLGITDLAPEVPRPGGKSLNESVPKSAAYLIRQTNMLSLPRERVVSLNAKIIESAQCSADLEGPQGAAAFYGEEDRKVIASLYDLGNRAFYNEFFPRPPQYRALPGLRAMNEAGLIPISLLDEFFHLFEQELLAIARKDRPKKQGLAGNRQPAKAAGGEGRKHFAQDAALSGFTSSIATRIRILFNKELRRTLGEARAIDASGRFDADYYLRQEPDASRYPGGPILHYVEAGAARGLNPCEWFNTKKYLIFNSDVAASGINAFYHFIKWGKKEGRALK